MFMYPVDQKFDTEGVACFCSMIPEAPLLFEKKLGVRGCDDLKVLFTHTAGGDAGCWMGLLAGLSARTSTY